VREVDGDALVVDAPRLTMRDGKLLLSELEPESLVRGYDGRGFVTSVRAGQWVAIHWGWACDRLSLDQRDRLERYTRYHIALCNQTI
jgi:hypothetical protein